MPPSASGDAKAGRKGQVGHLTESLQTVGEFRRERLAFAGDAAHGDDIDEAITPRDQFLGAFRRGGRGDEGNPRQPGGLGDGTQLGLFLMRHIDDKESIDTRRRGIRAAPAISASIAASVSAIEGKPQGM